MSRIDVNKTYKLFIGGAFPRSESGRVYEIKGANKKFIANPALASRKDLRDAVVAAKAAHSGWANATAFNRGQILYRVAEIMQGRSDQFIDEITKMAQKIEVGKDYGPATMPSQLNVIQSHLTDAANRGAKFAVGGADSVHAPLPLRRP